MITWRRINPYSIVLPCILAGAATGAIAFASEFAFGIAAIVISAVGIYGFADTLFGSRPLNCSKMIAIGLLLGYALTSVNTWYYARNLVVGMSGFVGESDSTLCVAIALIGISAAALFIMGEWVAIPIPLQVDTVSPTASAKWFVLIGFAIIAVAFAHGDLTYMGQAVGAQGAITVLGTLGEWLIAALFGMTLSVAICTKDRNEKMLFYGLLAAQAVLALPLGRRVFIYTLFLGGITARFCPMKKKGLNFRRGLVIAAGVGLSYVASVAFLYLRFATYEFDRGDKISLSQIVSKARTLSETLSSSDVSADLKENTLERGFILGFFSDLVMRSQTHPTAGGRDLANNLVGGIPGSSGRKKANARPSGRRTWRACCLTPTTRIRQTLS